jgi:hypothetical protein
LRWAGMPFFFVIHIQSIIYLEKSTLKYCEHAQNDFVGSLLPKSGTMGSKWGASQATGCSTSVKFKQYSTLHLVEMQSI